MREEKATAAGMSDFISLLRSHFTVYNLEERANETAEVRASRLAREIEWLRSIRSQIIGYDDVVLREAGKLILLRRTERSFPLPAEIHKACAEVVRDNNRGKLPLDREALKAPGWSTERERLADDLINCEMGRHAARDGWILGLHNFARKHARLPLHHEIDKLKREAVDFDEAYARCVRREVSHAFELQRLGDKMITRREELIQRLTG